MRLTLFLWMAMFLAVPHQAFAVDCGMAPLNKMIIDSAEVIFEGTPVSERDLTFTERAKLLTAGNRNAGSSTLRVYEFSVDRNWKNTTPNQKIEILRDISWGDVFLLNKDPYLVFSHRKQAGFYIADLCGHTAFLKIYQDDSPIEHMRGTMSLLEESIGEGIHIKIKRSDQVCSADSDCTIIQTDCGGCDCGTLVNKSARQHYLALYHKTCEAIGKIAMCEVYCEPTVPRCIEGYCSPN